VWISEGVTGSLDYRPGMHHPTMFLSCWGVPSEKPKIVEKICAGRLRDQRRDVRSLFSRGDFGETWMNKENADFTSANLEKRKHFYFIR